jgi:hypothetical protein
MYEEVRIFVTLLYMNACGVVHFHEGKVMGPFFYEEPVVNGDTFLAMMENNAL